MHTWGPCVSVDPVSVDLVICWTGPGPSIPAECNASRGEGSSALLSPKRLLSSGEDEGKYPWPVWS